MEGILAMDPAGPIFEDNNELKLGNNDAKAVQILHTDSDTLGYRDYWSYQRFFGASSFRIFINFLALEL